MSLAGLRIAVIGGDEREQEIARLAAVDGADVRAYGFPWPPDGIPGVERAGSAAEGLRGAGYALFPIPGIAADGSLFAPAAPEPIVPDAKLLAELAPAAHVILGASDDRLRQAAAATGVTLHEYEHDRELMLLRAPAIVEGALALAVQNTRVTIHGTEIGVVGYGTIGAALARSLVALGGHVRVFARNAVQRAAAYAAGAVPRSLEALADEAPELAMLFSSVPARVVDRDVLVGLPRGTLVMDLAAPPGSVDLKAAAELGLRPVWARGLGRRAPVTVGASQWLGIRKRIEAIKAWQ